MDQERTFPEQKYIPRGVVRDYFFFGPQNFDEKLQALIDKELQAMRTEFTEDLISNGVMGSDLSTGEFLRVQASIRDILPKTAESLSFYPVGWGWLSEEEKERFIKLYVANYFGQQDATSGITPDSEEYGSVVECIADKDLRTEYTQGFMDAYMYVKFLG